LVAGEETDGWEVKVEKRIIEKGKVDNLEF